MTRNHKIPELLTQLSMEFDACRVSINNFRDVMFAIFFIFFKRRFIRSPEIIDSAKNLNFVFVSF